MPASSKYPPELRERATRLAVEARRDPETRTGAISRIASQLGVHKEALRNWVRLAESGQTPATDGTPTLDTEARLRALEKENRELRRSNEILKSAAAFSRRSSTAHSDDRGLHRRESSPLGSRTDLHGALGPGRNPDRPRHLLRPREAPGLGPDPP